MKLVFLILIFVFSSCEWGDYYKDKPSQKQKKVEVNQKRNQKKIVLKTWDQIVNEITGGPSQAKLDGNLLYLDIDSQQFSETNNFALLLIELAKALVRESRPPFKIVIISGKGPSKTIYKARFYLDDVKQFLNNDFSEPELLRRFDIRQVETIESLSLKAFSLREQKIHPELILVLNKWLELDPLNIQALALLGNTYRDEKKYGDAIYIYQKILELEPQNIFAYHNLGFCFGNIGDFNQAIESYKKALEIKKDDILFLTQLAHMYRKNGDVNGALVAINKARAIRDNPDLWMIEGNLYRDQKQYPKAYQAYQKGLQASNNDTRFLYNLLLLDIDNKKLESVIKKYTELKEKDPTLAQNLQALEVLFDEN